MRTAAGLLALLVVTCTVGCDALSAVLSPNSITVSLVNNGDFDVDARLFIHDDDQVAELLITEVGRPRTLTALPGQTVSFTESCDDLQAMILENAELRVLGGIGPEASTDVLRDNDDFSCGDSVTLTFDHTSAIVDFDVRVSVE